MDWQSIAALAIVSCVGVLLVRWKIRDLRRELTTPCAGHCACTRPARPEHPRGSA
jgi:hypothetical protein